MLNPSGHVEDARLETDPQVLVEARTKIRIPLRLHQMMEDAHLSLVVGLPGNLRRAIGAELGIPGLPVAGTGEFRPDLPRTRFARGIRLASIAARDCRAPRQEGEAH